MAGWTDGLIATSRCVTAVCILAGCTGEPRAASHPVSPRTMGKLEAASASLDELEVKRTGSGFLVRGTWGSAAEVEVPMEWVSDLPHVRARVNGRDVSFILDTGSQGTVLEADTALACRVRTANKAAGSFAISGISGSETALMGVPDRIEIGSWHWEGMPCLVRTNQSEISAPWFIGSQRFAINVLGMDVLRRMCSYVTLDYPAKKVVFGFRNMFQPVAGDKAWRAPLETKDRLSYVRVGDGRREWRAVVDTGSTCCLEINHKTAESCARELVQRAEATPVVRVGVGTQRSASDGGAGTAHVRSLELLGPRLLNVPALLVPDCSKIGSGLLRPFRVTLDFRRSALWLEGSRH